MLNCEMDIYDYIDNAIDDYMSDYFDDLETDLLIDDCEPDDFEPDIPYQPRKEEYKQVQTVYGLQWIKLS